MHIWDHLNNLSNYLNTHGTDNIKNYFAEGNFDIMSEKLTSMKSALVDFDEIVTYDRNKMDLSTVEREVFQQCSTELLDIHNWKEALQQEIYYNWIMHMENNDPQLKTISFDTYEQNRNRIKDLMKESRNLTILQVISKIESEIFRPIRTRRPRKNQLSWENSLWFKISDDLSKKRKQIPVRKLMEKYETILFKISPCWLASPESVASIFSLKKDHFDLVVFDEASQLAVERSLPIMYRGKNIVILGDEKQLRPFDLFHVKDNDDEEPYEDHIDDSMLSESLLVLAKRIYGYRYLNWHYRSRYQELIDFSNHSFYDGKLNVVPNFVKTHNQPPIRWITCNNGQWVERKNIPEAILVVQEIKNILRQRKKEGKRPSIGVITFNDSQKTAVLDEIDNLRNADSEFNKLFSNAEDLEKNSLDDIPFVKNIENVQGDERSVIIFSIGYAKDDSGKLRTVFGTLNQEGGENRLNVAITRAREEIAIICSFDPNEMRTEGSKNEGPKRLKEYLQYAKSISERNYPLHNIINASNNLKTTSSKLPLEIGGPQIIDSKPRFEKSIEDVVEEKIRSLGYNTDKKVGNSKYKLNLAIVNPDDPTKYLLGIECDSNSFYNTNSVIERDVIRPQFLESRGWKIERTWSRNWWRNPEKELESTR